MISLPKFFTKQTDITDGEILIRGEDARHISRVLRMKKGEPIVVSDGMGARFQCRLSEIGETVRAEILSREPDEGEPLVSVTLYAALQKGDKFDFAVQKSVELGIKKIIVFPSARCVSRPDDRALAAKLERWRRIAREAAGQCGRGMAPDVEACGDYDTAVRQAAAHELPLFLYEGGTGVPLGQRLAVMFSDCAFMVGPEGGFTEQEHDAALRGGLLDTTLGKRILRCETVPLCVLSAVMFRAGEI